MSWSVSMIGTAEHIVVALEEESMRLTGQSKVEFDAAKPSLVELARNNFSADGQEPPRLELIASGSGTSGPDAKQLDRTCTVSLKRFWQRVL